MPAPIPRPIAPSRPWMPSGKCSTTRATPIPRRRVLAPDVALATLAITQVVQRARPVDLPVSRLKTVLQCGGDPLLSIGVSYSLAEQIGIATEVLDRSERNRIDALLDDSMTRGRNEAIR